MDLVTDAQVAVAVTVPVPRERMWELITAVERIGEWSPEAIGGSWDQPVLVPAAGARFTARNHFADGHIVTVSCVVTEAQPPDTFAWAVLDGDGRVGSAWRYELREGAEPGSTLVYHSFTHGPGRTGARSLAEADPRELGTRLVTMCRNMTATIDAMATSTTAMGANR